MKVSVILSPILVGLVLCSSWSCRTVGNGQSELEATRPSRPSARPAADSPLEKCFAVSDFDFREGKTDYRKAYLSGIKMVCTNKLAIRSAKPKYKLLLWRSEEVIDTFTIESVTTIGDDVLMQAAHTYEGHDAQIKFNTKSKELLIVNSRSVSNSDHPNEVFAYKFGARTADPIKAVAPHQEELVPNAEK